MCVYMCVYCNFLFFLTSFHSSSRYELTMDWNTWDGLGLNASILPCNCRDEFFVNVCTCVCIVNVMVSR